MGDVLRLRRRHPCGGFEWEVVRVGADIGLRCRTCRRRVLLSRATLRRRLERVVARGEPPDPAMERALLHGSAPPHTGGQAAVPPPEGLTRLH